MRHITYEDFKKIPTPTEQQIIENWTTHDTQPVVSVLCLTYNHKNYIHDAIHGILIQKTSFPFEIIIHDDASTDGTSEIIMDYQKKYPNIIKTIIQKENQWSQGKHHVFLNATKEARGEFVAICDGDDYWISEEKLSLQINALRSNPECAICFHKSLTAPPGASTITTPSTKEKIRQMMAYPTRDAIIKTNPIIIGDGNYMITTAIVIKKQILSNLPAWFMECPVGDLFFQIIGSLPGGAIFIPRHMSVYRINTAGSWTTDTYSSAEKAANFYNKMVSSLTLLDKHLEQKYTFEIKFLIKTLTIFGVYRNYLKKSPTTSHGFFSKPINRIKSKYPRAQFLLIRIAKNIILTGYSLTAKHPRSSTKISNTRNLSQNRISEHEIPQP